MDVVISGTVAFDTVKTPFGYEKDILGGSATYASIAASRFCKAGVAGVVGADFSDKYTNVFKKAKIDTLGIEVISDGKTFSWEGEYGKDFNNPETIATNLNVLADYKPKVPSSYVDCKFLFLANLDPDIQLDILGQFKKPRFVVCDTMNFWIVNKKKSLIDLIKRVDFFLLNETEIRMLTDETNILCAASKLMKYGLKGLIVKRGEYGAVMFMGNSVFCLPAYLLDKVYDPTGAGDSFAGGFIGYLAGQKTINSGFLRKAVVYGSVMATFAVEDFSVRGLVKNKLSDVNKRYKGFSKITGF
ncbi:MAG: PfkB family carbohydrate kinase [Candidatus Omnitrophica bacterium]|nr:PfkB family carbohydrate kinase [Candidatus Omnitrophota bacterium]